MEVGIHVIPLYIAVDDGVVLERALEEGTAAEKTKLCGAVPGDFWADEADFSRENLQRLGIEKAYENEDF